MNPLSEWVKAGRPNLDDDRWLLRSVAWFPIVFVALLLCMRAVKPGLYAYLGREDGFLEWGGALAFGAAGGFAFRLATRLWRDRRSVLAALYGVLAVGMLVMMMEEISWGQRILNLENPEFFREHSTKEEINIHNLQEFPLGPAFITVGFYGAFSRWLVPGSVRRRFPSEAKLLTPRFAIATCFLPTFAFYTYWEYWYYTVVRPLGITIRRSYPWEGGFITGKEQEIVEFLLAMGFLIFVFNNWQRYKARSAVAATAEQMPKFREVDRQAPE
ncbi:MAG: hypothetical protein ACREQ8_13300 [Woeseiaceae bacterium]